MILKLTDIGILAIGILDIGKLADGLQAKLIFA